MATRHKYRQQNQVLGLKKAMHYSTLTSEAHFLTIITVYGKDVTFWHIHIF